MDVISGVSLDYAVVAQAEMPLLPLHSLDSVFTTEYGVTLFDVTESYQRQLQNSIERAEAKADRAEAKAEQVRVDLNSCIDHINAIYDSKSYKATAPLRWMSLQVRTLYRGGLRLFRKLLCSCGQ
jgi:hypothetical protein